VFALWFDDDQCFDAVGCVIWPVKTVFEMTYNVSNKPDVKFLLTRLMH